MNKHNSKAILCFYINVTLLKDRIWDLSCSRVGAVLLGFIFWFSLSSDFFFLFNFMEQSSNFLPYSPKRIAFESAKSRLFSQICILLFVCVSLSIMYFCSRTCHNLFPHFCNCLRKSDLPPLLPTAYLLNLLLESQILKH